MSVPVPLVSAAEFTLLLLLLVPPALLVTLLAGAEVEAELVAVVGALRVAGTGTDVPPLVVEAVLVPVLALTGLAVLMVVVLAAEGVAAGPVTTPRGTVTITGGGNADALCAGVFSLSLPFLLFLSRPGEVGEEGGEGERERTPEEVDGVEEGTSVLGPDPA